MNMRGIRGMLRKVKVRVDGPFRAELQRLADDDYARKTFFSRRGLTVDEFGERIWDAGFVAERPTPREVLDILDDAVRPAAAPEPLSGRPVDIIEILLDGKPHSLGQIRSALHIDFSTCICRDIRRLRSKTYGCLEVQVRRGRYQLTAKDVATAKQLLRQRTERDVADEVGAQWHG